MANLLIIVFVLLTLAVAQWLPWRRQRLQIGPLLWLLVLGAGGAGRLAFVLAHVDAYAHAPWQVLDLRDGGVSPMAAMVAAVAVALDGVRRRPHLRRPLYQALAAGAAALVIGSVAAPLLAPPSPQLPDLTVHTLAGTPVALASFKGKPVAINLWASWCPPCRRELPLLAAAQARRPDVQFLFINQGESASVIQAYLAPRPFRLRHVLVDRLQRVGQASASSAMPITLFFDRHGKLLERHVGELDAAALAAALEQFTADRSTPIASIPAVEASAPR